MGYYPGEGYFYVLCDVCGIKIRRRDAVLITGKYNTQRGLVVCKKDADSTNPQAIPYTVKEKQISDYKSIRSQPTDTYVVNSNSNRAPSAPIALTAKGDPAGNGVLLQWLGPDDTGTSPIIGYVILRGDPQDLPRSVIADDTGTVFTYYVDTSFTVDVHYAYTVKAINAFGTSSESNIAYFPTQDDFGAEYLLTSQDDSYLLTGSDSYIVV